MFQRKILLWRWERASIGKGKKVSGITLLDGHPRYPGSIIRIFLVTFWRDRILAAGRAGDGQDLWARLSRRTRRLAGGTLRVITVARNRAVPLC
jgi:hypothetical protein